MGNTAHHLSGRNIPERSVECGEQCFPIRWDHIHQHTSKGTRNTCIFPSILQMYLTMIQMQLTSSETSVLWKLPLRKTATDELFIWMRNVRPRVVISYLVPICFLLSALFGSWVCSILVFLITSESYGLFLFYKILKHSENLWIDLQNEKVDKNFWIKFHGK